MRIDLNADLGESFGAWRLGDDEAMLDVVTSANVACGFHAGDPLTISRTCAAAAARGVVVGAQVGYRDLVGFGRRAMAVAPEELRAEVVYQIGALDALCRTVGTAVRYVKPHGALYNTAVHDERQAAAVVEAVAALDPALPILGLPGSALLRLAEQAGLPTVAEAFADRGYQPDGTLVPRDRLGALLHAPQQVADRMVHLVTEGTVVAVDGTVVAVPADSICTHGDTPAAVSIARSVRAALESAGVAIAPFVDAGTSG